ncbi:MAG TPA: efflux RND transporter periplasmic adaptor subunit [Xanthobacteraceae bacterium]|jgi:RND family efflux transporter MFP subunit|nr:efflux RND transporter periplasmic adaptor subunit [Xanthobacteraceae bacterium]
MTFVNAARLAVFVTAATALSVILAGCGQGQQQSGGPPPPTVTVANPVQRTVIDQDEYVGRFAAVNSVEIRSRLSGYLSEIHFQDGQMVKQGDLLFTIDRRPFEIALEQMRANLAQARANLSFTDADLERGKPLLANRSISEQVFDQRTQAKAVAAAAVAAQEAMVHSAELDLDTYSELRSPIDGRIGDRRVAVGNLVTGGNTTTTLLATVVSVDPIRFEFTFDEAAYLRYVRFATASKEVAALNGNVPVALKLIDEKDFAHSGKIDFVDNVINQSTGTIRGRALFDNHDGIFTPGMFGRLRVPGSPPYTALLVPDAAIGSEQVRKYVLVVDDAGMVSQKYVTLGQLDGGLRVIKDGLAASDHVIVNGLMRARPGVKVKAEQQGAPPPNAAGNQAKSG